MKNMALKTNPFAFLQQVRAEVAKVVWPTRRETVVTTIMTLILVFITAIFFFIIDQVLSYGTGLIFG
jgi:preprotein translocase subunit SecE